MAAAVLRRVDPAATLEWLVQDGAAVASGETLGMARGSARSILVAERVMLNFMQRMSGVASLTAQMVAAVQVGGGWGTPASIVWVWRGGCTPCVCLFHLRALTHTPLLALAPPPQGTRAVVLDTRKTVPGLRLLDKWAVAIGGGQNHRWARVGGLCCCMTCKPARKMKTPRAVTGFAPHTPTPLHHTHVCRMGLYDMVMIKDNHIAAAGGIAAAVRGAEVRARVLLDAPPALPPTHPRMQPPLIHPPGVHAQQAGAAAAGSGDAHSG